MSDIMTTYATPLDRAKSLRDDLIAFAEVRSYPLPTPRYVQIGDIVRDCEAVVVSVGSLTPDQLYDPIECVSPRQATFLVEIIRSCAVVYTQNGRTIPEALEAVSERGAADGQLLDDFARESIDGWTSKQPWSVVWSLAEGGLQVASLQITIGLP
jgi:hypothetical protein